MLSFHIHLHSFLADKSRILASLSPSRCLLSFCLALLFSTSRSSLLFIVVYISPVLLVVACLFLFHPCPPGFSEHSHDLRLRSAFIDYLRPNAEEIENGGRRPCIFTNVCAINYRANSLFGSQLNRNIIYTIQVTRQKQTQPLPRKGTLGVQKRMGSFPQNKRRK